jgi:hypothetical protein
MRLQVPWINRLAGGLTVKDIETVHRVTLALRQAGNGESEGRD